MTIWLNRQIDPAAANLDAPMGVFGYRVDARTSGETRWHTLCHARGPVRVGPVKLPDFDGDRGVEVHPVQLHGQKTGDYWLATYFAAWTGPSLAGVDVDTIFLGGGPDVSDPTRVQGVAPDLDLRYGHTYEFRVRLMDHTAGGPLLDGRPLIPGPAPIATMPFRRWIRPLRLKLLDTLPIPPDPTTPPSSVTVERPLLVHPAVALTCGYTDPIALLRADLPVAKTEGRGIGLPDPDVDAALIVVEAQGLLQDPSATDNTGYQKLYETTEASRVISGLHCGSI